ncbi:glycoside hydrolase family 13 protein [Streptomyces iconiensis]|uniref:Glycoside hydrolase family 13 protein n=1 Tax=Streptomyces iconiensis TaxID=1384038 RepID=A0ABT7A9Y5_9ACTN|nr:glycoside hydrolase family 13 protein [Streptomyces iconiensis]MDJ1137413.1 glycoside hydrolase family 13 protein [Streptomyces iconiensis]
MNQHSSAAAAASGGAAASAGASASVGRRDVVTGREGVALSAGEPGAAEWWRGAVIYQVYPRSFADGNGDGMGDLKGARERLPYLAELGVDAVWLSPFYASPQADAGYDVADYRAIDPMFGTLHDADALIREAHELGLRVLVDVVPNHSSDRHEWFQRALQGDRAARERYHFRQGKGEHGELPPNDWESIFGGPAWTRVPSAGLWYLHLFAPEQPDFNWEHPAVRDEFRSVLRFWLDMGVDGFRIDVAHGLVKAEGLPDMGSTDQLKLLGNQQLPFFDQDGVHEIYRSWRAVLDEYPGERIGVAEAWAPSAERTALYVREDELHQAFNFHYLNTGWEAEPLREVIDESLDSLGAVGAPATWVLSNHDVVRHRTRLGGGHTRGRAASLLMLALPGSAYVYQGEELGLPEVTELPDAARQDPSFFRDNGQDGLRDGCRVPLPWTEEQGAGSYGFGAGGSWLPQPAGWGALSVAAQTGDPDSTLELYREALRLRRERPELGAGEPLEWLPAPEGVLAFRRGGFVCTANTGAGAAELGAVPGELLLASGPYDGGRTLPGDTTAWWVGG